MTTSPGTVRTLPHSVATWDHTAGLPLLLTEHTDTATTAHLYGPDGTVFETIHPNGTITYLHHDQLGSTRLVTTPTGTTTGTATYDPYGTPTTTGTIGPFGYAGQYTDPTGLQYLRARYYDPTTGEFLTRDPLTTLTRTPYAYANNNPLNLTDPTGLAPWDGICIAINNPNCDNTATRQIAGNFCHGEREGGGGGGGGGGRRRRGLLLA